MAVPDELQGQLQAFFRDASGDDAAGVEGLESMPGHAGFSYGFTAHYRRDGQAAAEPLVLRLAPPNVKLEGTADVMRQVKVLAAVRGSGVPVVSVRFAGEDARWFGRPYFMVPRLQGDTLRSGPGEWGVSLPAEQLRAMGRQAMQALAALHRLDWREKAPELGPPLEPAFDVERWDRFFDRSAEPELMGPGAELKRKLLARLPRTPRVGIFHGDFQFTNLFYGGERGERLLAVIDWELVGIGQVLNDLGWMMIFVDDASWAHALAPQLPTPAEMEAMYAEAWGADPGDVAWYRALAGYKFGVITGFNLMLHRRGKRDDPHWEELGPSITTLFERGLAVLDGAR
jgi:aminoglycoside phosphotransferase (APT) family kinase protein